MRPRGMMAALAAGAVALTMAALPAGATADDDGVLVRKNVAALTAAERAQFVGALLQLKRTPSPYDSHLSWYDQLVQWHVYLARCDPLDPLMKDAMWGHAGPMFLPWHRQYLRVLEEAMREVTGEEIAVPYWDWTNAESTHAVFSDGFMGGDGDPRQDYAVTSGPFRKGAWDLKVQDVGLFWGQSASSWIRRRFGSSPLAPTLPTRADEEAALRAPRYDAAPFNDSSDPRRSFRNALEGYRNPLSLTGCMPDRTNGTVPLGEAQVHNRAHGWVGGSLPPSAEGVMRFGTLAVNVASPNDPVFFLLHSNVDRIWAEWQGLHPGETFLPRSGYRHNSAGDVLRPFEETGEATTPADVEDIERLGYRYEPPGRAAPARTGPQPLATADMVCAL